MKLRVFDFTGYFEDQDGSSSEKLQILVPEDELETDMLAWALMPRPETVEADHARRGYVFHYELADHLGEGLYALKVNSRDASGVDHAAEIAAAIVVVATPGGQRMHAFTPFWLLSESLHFKPLEGMTQEQYHGAAYGHLIFADAAVLPHRRLFGATV